MRVLRTFWFPFSSNNAHVSLDNWQTALRKQYNKRDPPANPLGPEPKINDLSNQDDIDQQPVDGEPAFQLVDIPALTSRSPPHTSHLDDQLVSHQQVLNGNNSHINGKDISIDWLQLPMLSKLESMHALVEWQFQHPTRLRNIMKSDDELALWVRSIRHFPSTAYTLNYCHLNSA